MYCRGVSATRSDNPTLRRTLAEIRRNVSNPQLAIGIAVVGVRLNQLLERLGVLEVPAAVFFMDHPGVVGGMKMDRVKQVVVGLDVVGAK
jgi:hypothetical protein